MLIDGTAIYLVNRFLNETVIKYKDESYQKTWEKFEDCTLIKYEEMQSKDDKFLVRFCVWLKFRPLLIIPLYLYCHDILPK